MITRRDWLEKKPSSGKSGSWQKRWVVLEQNGERAKISWYAGEAPLCCAPLRVCGAHRVFLVKHRVSSHQHACTTRVVNTCVCHPRHTSHIAEPCTEASDYPHKPKGEFPLTGGNSVTVSESAEGLVLTDGKSSLPLRHSQAKQPHVELSAQALRPQRASGLLQRAPLSARAYASGHPELWPQPRPTIAWAVLSWLAKSAGRGFSATDGPMIRMLPT